MKLKVVLLFIILISLTGCEVFDAAVTRAVQQTQTEKEAVVKTATKSSPSIMKTISNISKNPTITPLTQEKFTAASTIKIGQVGETLEVYGRVTFVGEEHCPNCPNGYYSYLIVDKNFYIISYDWVFNSGMVGECILVKDVVEPFGSKPTFVFGSKEGYDGSKCEYLADGTLTCKGGDYFKAYSGCRN